MRKLIIVAVILLIIVSCENKRERIQRDGEPEVLLGQPEDAGMNAAIENAKKTFQTNFHPALISRNPDFSNFAIKQRFDTQEGGEHIWIGDIVFDNGRYRGIVQNEPVNPLDIKLGDEIVVNLDNLSDWMYYDKNVVKGAYTVKVLRETMSDEEKKEMDSQGLIYE